MTKTQQPTLQQQGIQIIRSCETVEQFVTARRWIERARHVDNLVAERLLSELILQTCIKLNRLGLSQYTKQIKYINWKLQSTS